MRTKTLLIAAAAALAAAVTSSQAQTVYSQNIVGYVNQTFPNPGDYYMICAPLTSTNTPAQNLLTCAQTFDTVLLWNSGSGSYGVYTYYYPGYGSDGGPWADVNGNPTTSPVIGPGEGFFYQTGSGSIETNTYTGTVLLTNTISFPLAGNYYMVGSAVPVAGLAQSTNFNLPFQTFDTILAWNTTSGTYSTYTYYYPGYGSDGGPWADVNGNPTTSPTINVGEGFFYQTGSGSSETWTQNDSYINP